MKSKDKTKQKKHESTIGKIIYGFLLFMPLLAIGVTCAYAIFNKNAYKSANGITCEQEQYKPITSFDNLVDGNTYRFNLKNSITTANANVRIYCSNIHVLNTSLSSTYIENLENANYFAIWYDSRIYFTANNLGTNVSSTSNNLVFEFTFISVTTSNVTQNMETLFDSMITSNQITQVNNSLDNVFYYSIDKVQQSPLFNWAENSVIYTGMANTCNAIDITTPFIPLLMTYWLIISVIYFLYDIILIILHIFHRKIHELEESI